MQMSDSQKRMADHWPIKVSSSSQEAPTVVFHITVHLRTFDLRCLGLNLGFCMPTKPGFHHCITNLPQGGSATLFFAFLPKCISYLLHVFGHNVSASSVLDFGN